MVEGLVLSTSLLLTPTSILLLDEPIREWAQTHRSRRADLLFGGINTLGDGKVHLVGWGSLALLGYVLKDEGMRDFGGWGEVSFLITGTATVALKALFGRARPSVGLGPTAFHPLNLDDDFHSLPSGHTSVAFSAAGYVFARTSNAWVRWSGLLLASGVGAARIYFDRHWLSDVIMGAGIGFSVGYLIGRWRESQDAAL